ncbi:MAG: hypothetical protein FWF45_03260 [Coriobacteriia bacterium]|nr:hypothetical protein [Coriobacteriia bacterium]
MDRAFRKVEHAMVAVIVVVIVLAGGIPAAVALIPRFTSGRTVAARTASAVKGSSISQSQHAASEAAAISSAQYAAYDQNVHPQNINAPEEPTVLIGTQTKAILPQETLVLAQQQQRISSWNGKKQGMIKAPAPISQSSADAKALAVLHKSGLSGTEISEAWWIHMHESISWTGVNPTSGAAGGWQILLSSHPGVTQTEAFDPAWSTKWILHYMRGGRYQSIHEAFNHKLTYGWY